MDIISTDISLLLKDGPTKSRPGPVLFFGFLDEIVDRSTISAIHNLEFPRDEISRFRIKLALSRRGEVRSTNKTIDNRQHEW